jgi:flavin-dependent dehydrogenase
VVVGADGANSVVGRGLNARENFFWQTGLYCEIPEARLRPTLVEPDMMRIDWGSLPCGYAWLFPKKDYVNVGVGCPAPLARFLRPYLNRFLSAEGLLRGSDRAGLRFAGHNLPTLTSRTRLAGGGVLLVGDAAGLVEPFTGDGISYACHSAEIAAESILAHLDGRTEGLGQYAERIWKEIGAELIWSRKLLSYSVTFPRLIYRLLHGNDKVWEVFCRVLRGQDTFESLKKTILGPLELLWAPLEHFVVRNERRKLADRSFLPALLTARG